MRRGFLGLLAAAFAITGTSASAQVRDAVYRGTMVCDKLPFTVGNGREAIEVTIAGNAVRYTHAVRLHGVAAPTSEAGTGALSGNNISLQGSWKSGNRQYEAKYSGTFVRRHASLKGTQVWIALAELIWSSNSVFTGRNSRLLSHGFGDVCLPAARNGGVRPFRRVCRQLVR
jgi:hypothetical protein